MQTEEKSEAASATPPITPPKEDVIAEGEKVLASPEKITPKKSASQDENASKTPSAEKGEKARRRETSTNVGVADESHRVSGAVGGIVRPKTSSSLVSIKKKTTKKVERSTKSAR